MATFEKCMFINIAMGFYIKICKTIAVAVKEWVEGNNRAENLFVACINSLFVQALPLCDNFSLEGDMS